MEKDYTIAEARRDLAAIVREVERTGRARITRRGRPVAVMLSIAEFERLSSTRREPDWNRDRRKPLGFPLPHHRTYGSRIRRFDELNSYRGARFGSPKLVKKRNGSASASAGVFDNRHGP